MNLSVPNSLLYGFLAGLTEILPVSARAHIQLLLKIYGQQEDLVLNLLVHLAVLGALYRANAAVISKTARAIALTRVPKRKRTRPLDTRSLMDFRLFRTTVIPVVVLYLFYGKVHTLDSKLAILAGLVLLNGAILYAPQFFPTGNKDARHMSRVDGLLIGLGQGLSVFPGISAMGGALSVGSILGVDRKVNLNLALLTQIAVMACLVVNDIIGMIAGGIGAFSFGILLKYLLGAAGAYLGCSLGVRLMRKLFAESNLQFMAFYCWGFSFLVFFLNLMA